MTIIATIQRLQNIEHVLLELSLRASHVHFYSTAQYYVYVKKKDFSVTVGVYTTTYLTQEKNWDFPLGFKDFWVFCPRTIRGISSVLCSSFFHDFCLFGTMKMAKMTTIAAFSKRISRFVPIFFAHSID